MENTKTELLEPKEIEREKYSEEDYDEMLDSEGEVKVCGLTFDPSQILKELDPIAYNCGFSDYQEYETVWQCPICEKEFDDDEEEEAKFCCQEEPEEDEEEEQEETE